MKIAIIGAGKIGTARTCRDGETRIEQLFFGERYFD